MNEVNNNNGSQSDRNSNSTSSRQKDFKWADPICCCKEGLAPEVKARPWLWHGWFGWPGPRESRNSSYAYKPCIISPGSRYAPDSWGPSYCICRFNPRTGKCEKWETRMKMHWMILKMKKDLENRG